MVPYVIFKLLPMHTWGVSYVGSLVTGSMEVLTSWVVASNQWLIFPPASTRSGYEHKRSKYWDLGVHPSSIKNMGSYNAIINQNHGFVKCHHPSKSWVPNLMPSSIKSPSNAIINQNHVVHKMPSTKSWVPIMPPSKSWVPKMPSSKSWVPIMPSSIKIMGS